MHCASGPAVSGRPLSNGSAFKNYTYLPAFEQGSVPSAFYLLREGRCEVECAAPAADPSANSSANSSGGRHVVAELRAGDHFGETALLEARTARNSGVRCTDPTGCALAVVGAAAFESRMREHPKLEESLRAVAAQVSAEIHPRSARDTPEIHTRSARDHRLSVTARARPRSAIAAGFARRSRWWPRARSERW